MKKMSSGLRFFCSCLSFFSKLCIANLHPTQEVFCIWRKIQIFNLIITILNCKQKIHPIHRVSEPSISRVSKNLLNHFSHQGNKGDTVGEIMNWNKELGCWCWDVRTAIPVSVPALLQHNYFEKSQNRIWKQSTDNRIILTTGNRLLLTLLPPVEVFWWLCNFWKMKLWLHNWAASSNHCVRTG